FPIDAEWTSGFELAEKVDLLLHDAQYTRAEYPRHVGWGHSTVHHALAFARLVGARHLVAFHHDPGRDDAALEAAIDAAVADVSPDFPVTAAAEGHTFDLDGPPPGAEPVPSRPGRQPARPGHRPP